MEKVRVLGRTGAVLAWTMLFCPIPLISATVLTVNTNTDSNFPLGSFSGSSGDLRGCLNFVNKNPGDYDIQFSGNYTIGINNMLPVVNLFSNTNHVTINTTSPMNVTIDGQGINKAFIISQGNVTINGMTLVDCFAHGGDGGGFGGGGGMGAGAAVLIDAGNVTLSNMTITDCKAQGGKGGGANSVSSLSSANSGGCGGGGGMGGNGGNGVAVSIPQDMSTGAGGGIGDYGVNGIGGNGGLLLFPGLVGTQGGGRGGGGGLQANGGNGGDGGASGSSQVGGGGGGGALYASGGDGADGGTSNGNNGQAQGNSFTPLSGGGGGAAGSGNTPQVGGLGGNGALTITGAGGGGGTNATSSTTINGVSGGPGGGGGGGSYFQFSASRQYGSGGNGGIGGGGGGMCGGVVHIDKTKKGGNGGWGGGGGAGGSSGVGSGIGGFGGGGSGAGYFMPGAAGGFGGGGGGGVQNGGPGSGGFGGGVGGVGGTTATTQGSGVGGGYSRGGGGGGAAFGGAIFVNTGSLTLSGALNINLPAGAVVGGAGGDPNAPALAGFSGYAAGENIFALQDITLSPGLSDSFTIAGSISDGSLNSVPATGTSTPGSGAGIKLIKTGAGIAIIQGINTYAGGTVLNQGTLNVNADTALGKQGTGISATGTSTLQLASSFTETGAMSRAISITDGVTFGIDTNGFNFTTEGVISSTGANTGALNKIGNGTLTLISTSTYGGGTTISGGVLSLQTSSGKLAASGAVSIATGATFDISSSPISPQIIGDLLDADAGPGFGSVTLGSNTLQFGTSTPTQTFSGTISDTLPGGSIIKVGTGNAILAGVNTYTGTTNISAGTLTLGGASSDIPNSPLVTVSSGATLAIASNQTIQELVGASGSFVTIGASDDLTFTGTGVSTVFAGVISGSGSVTKTSGNLAVFTGANTYSGGTTISGGTLSLRGTQGSLNPLGAVDVVSGTFDISTSGLSPQIIGDLTGTSSGDVTLGANTLRFGSSNSPGPFAGVISGTGSVVKKGSGTATFTGANLYTGGTTIFNGTLSLGAGGSLDSGSSLIIGVLPLVFTPTFDISAGGNQIIGDLLGNNRGVINLGSNTLTFGTNHTIPSVFGGSVTGSVTSSLIKQNSGRAIFTGASTFTGPTIVQGGTFVMNGSLAGDIVVNSGATLRGTGSIAGSATIDNGGTIRPGTSIGVLHVGSLILSSSSNTYIELRPQTNSVATGSSTLAVDTTAPLDGTLTIQAPPGFYPNNQSYTLLTAGTSLSSTFSSVVLAPGSQDLGTYQILYDYASSPKTVMLHLGEIPHNFINISIIHCGSNPVHVAEYLNQFNEDPILGPVVFDLSMLSPNDLCRALNSISPARNATGSFVSQNTMFLIASTVSNRMAQQRLMMRDLQMQKKEFSEVSFGALPRKPTSLSASSFQLAGLATQSLADTAQWTRRSWGTYLQENEMGEEELPFSDDNSTLTQSRSPQGSAANIARGEQQFALWAEGLGEWISQDPGRGNPGYDSHTGGGLLGFDYYGEEGLMGVALCYAKSRVHQNFHAGENTVDYYAGTIYGTVYIDDGYIELGLAGAYNDFFNERHVRYAHFSGGSFNETATSKYWGAQLVPHLGGGYDWNFDWGTLEPFAALDCDVLYHPAFTETGADPLNMHQPSSWSELLRSELGLHAYEVWTTCVGDFILRETLSYVNKQPFHIGKINANIVGFPPGFTVDSFNNNQNFISPSLQFFYRGPKGTFCSASYAGEFQWGYGAYMSNSLLVQLGAYF